jgi:transcriptional regulator with XRE-family HTH domain
MANGTTLRVRSDIRLNELIRLARLAAGFERKELAQRLGLSKRTYERIEDGSRQPRAGEVVAIAQITGQDVELFGDPSFDNAAGAGP